MSSSSPWSRGAAEGPTCLVSSPRQRWRSVTRALLVGSARIEDLRCLLQRARFIWPPPHYPSASLPALPGSAAHPATLPLSVLKNLLPAPHWICPHRSLDPNQGSAMALPQRRGESRTDPPSRHGSPTAKAWRIRPPSLVFELDWSSSEGREETYYS